MLHVNGGVVIGEDDLFVVWTQFAMILCPGRVKCVRQVKVRTCMDIKKIERKTAGTR